MCDLIFGEMWGGEWTGGGGHLATKHNKTTDPTSARLCSHDNLKHTNRHDPHTLNVTHRFLKNQGETRDHNDINTNNHRYTNIVENLRKQTCGDSIKSEGNSRNFEDINAHRRHRSRRDVPKKRNCQRQWKKSKTIRSEL